MNPSNDEVNPYLEQEVFSASPIRLRWMLICRAEELCVEVQRLWAVNEREMASSWLLKIREILGELLDGVQDAQNPASKPVSDFYIFLLQVLNEAEATYNSGQLKTLEELLHIENETWRMVVQRLLASEGASGGDEQTAGTTPKGIPFLTQDGNSMDWQGELNLEF
jgi:flagellin-specific chaperone FliS